MADNLLTTKAAAGYLGVPEKTIRRWLLAGLPHYRLGAGPVPGGRIMINRADLDQWLDSLRVQINTRTNRVVKRNASRHGKG